MGIPKFTLFVILCLLTLTGCQRTPQTKTTNAKFSLFIMDKEGQHFIAMIDQLDSGTLDLKKQAVAIPNTRFDRSIISKDNHYYYLHYPSGQFVHYQLHEHGLQAIDSIAMGTRHIENKYWIDAHHLILFTLDNATSSQLTYWHIQVPEMKILAQKEVAIPKGPSNFPLLSIGYSFIQNGKILIGYCYNSASDQHDYTSQDTMYTIQFDYPSFERPTIHKDPRSSYPGGINTVQSYSFIDEEGDFYFMSCPGIALGNVPDLPTGIFRIKKGQAMTDPDYMINLSDRLDNHAYGFWYVGGGKALIRNERKDRYQSFADHHSSYHFEYQVVNLKSKQLQKLDLPFDKGTRKESVYVNGEQVYIAIDDQNDNHQLWIYTPSNGKFEKGLQFNKQADFILRIDQQ